VHDKYFIKYLEPVSAIKLVKLLIKFDFVIGPDYSLLGDAPEQNRMMNVSRNLNLMAFMQNNGVNVIPNVRCLGEESYKYAFLGIPKKSIIAVSSYGNIKTLDNRQTFLKDLDQIFLVLEPREVIIYGSFPNEIEFLYPHIQFHHIDNYLKLKLKKPTPLLEQGADKSDFLTGQSPIHSTTISTKGGEQKSG
jgi:hypothetical protein